MNVCPCCQKAFPTVRGLKSHIQHRNECLTFFHNNPTFVGYQNNEKNNNSEVEFEANNNISSDIDEMTDHENTDDNNELILQQLRHSQSGYNDVWGNNDEHTSQIELLFLLKKARVPLYLFDDIIKWTKNAAEQYNINFLNGGISNRNNCINNLKNQYDLTGLTPTKVSVKLRGSGSRVNLIIHDFKQCLYSLLNDSFLMQEENLLYTKENLYYQEKKRQSTLNDIDTGTVFQKAQEIYLRKDSKDVLCPVIFFIDKTHTDTNGRLCLEQVRFTLGIFNRKTRNTPLAWRTLGYISDQAYITAESTEEKMSDYHHMIEIILKEYKRCQAQKFEWDLNFNDQTICKVFFVLSVLFIIGDTDGHDKLAGRYLSRNNVSMLCRNCNTPYNETDNPDYPFTYHKHQRLFAALAKSDEVQLKAMSMHRIKNAWKNIRFCDPVRGLFGGTCADVLHCLQHGLFNYAHQALFQRRQSTNKNEIDQEDNYNENSTGCRKVFSSKYIKRFDKLATRYGLYLSHQSDRQLPRTHIHTNYTTTTRKNANEMSGVLLVILIVFMTDEGETKLDDAMAEIQSAKFIHLLELLLMLENFCLAPEHKIKDIKLFKKFVPFILNTYRETIDRRTGNQAKFIKFHLPNHFADDILRFGSMLNYDTGIGESHHKSEAKHPAKNTQRRRIEFEFQVATRQVENLAIDMGMARLEEEEEKKNLTNKKEIENKWFRYFYDDELGLCSSKNKNKCKWPDSLFQEQIIHFCKKLILSHSVIGKIRFFSQHNRHNYIFRADPEFKFKEPWYDWVRIQWAHDLIPAKLLLFMEITEEQFVKPFQLDTLYIGNPGEYAFIYSLESSSFMEAAHLTSSLMQFGTLDLDNQLQPKLNLVEVDCIHSAISGVPYHCEINQIDAKEWIFLKPKCEWYEIFIELINKTILDYENNND
jgi:Plavaka transposase